MGKYDTIRVHPFESLAPAWDDVRLSLNAASVGAAAPTLTVFRSPVKAYAFSKTTPQQLAFDVQLPHSWAGPASSLYAEIRPHVHWATAAGGTGSTFVRWQLTYTWANLGDAFAAPTVMDAVDAIASTTAYEHQIDSLGHIDGTGKRASSVLMCQLERLATADDFDDVAFALSVDFHIQTAGHGSAAEYPGA